VLKQDPWTWSLLLERVEPGTRLSDADLPVARALAIASELFAKFVEVDIPADVPDLADIMTGYLSNAHGRLDGQRAELEALGVRELVESGLADVAALAASTDDDYFLHGDYNPGNLLLDEHEGSDRWRVIDPKPMRGDREFDLWPLVEQLGSPWTRPDPASVLRDQLLLVTENTGCDYARAARWAFGRSALDVTWYLEDSNREAAAAAARKLRIAREL
jgi:streptomycin 6-kinase